MKPEVATSPHWLFKPSRLFTTTDACDRRLAAKAGVEAMPGVFLQPGVQVGGALVLVVAAARPSPLDQCGPDEALGVTIGVRHR